MIPTNQNIKFHKDVAKVMTVVNFLLGGYIFVPYFMSYVLTTLFMFMHSCARSIPKTIDTDLPSESHNLCTKYRSI